MLDSIARRGSRKAGAQLVNRIISYAGLVMTSLGLFLPFRMEQLYGSQGGRAAVIIISDQPLYDNPLAPLGPLFLVLIISGALLTVFEKPTLALSVSIILLAGIFLPLSEAILFLDVGIIGTGGGLMLIGGATFSMASAHGFRARRGE